MRLLLVPPSERRPGPVEPADDVEVSLGVHLDVRDPGDGARDLAQHPPRRPARRAEGAGELQQRRALARRRPELGEQRAQVGAVAHAAPPVPVPVRCGRNARGGAALPRAPNPSPIMELWHAR